MIFRVLFGGGGFVAMVGLGAGTMGRAVGGGAAVDPGDRLLAGDSFWPRYRVERRALGLAGLELAAAGMGIKAPQRRHRNEIALAAYAVGVLGARSWRRRSVSKTPG